MSLTKKKEELSSQQRPIQQSLRDIEVKLTNFKYEIDQMRDKLINDSKSIQFKINSDLSTDSDYLNLKQQFEKGLEDLNSKPVRMPQKSQTIINLLAKPPQGLLGVFCDLAWIDDAVESELLARIMQTKMSVLVFDNSENSSLFLNANRNSKETFQVISPDIATPMRVPKETSPGSLFPPVTGPTEGFLGYMLDRIKVK